MNFNSEMWGAVVSIFLAIIGVASLAVFLSRNSNTAGILNAATGGLATDLNAAEAPVTGAANTGPASYGGASYMPAGSGFSLEA